MIEQVYKDVPSEPDTSGSAYSGKDDLGRLEGTVRRNSRAALPPLSFTAKRQDGGVRFTIIDRGPLVECNGAVRYDIYWAEDVDLSTVDTVAAGFARATAVESIPAPGKEGADATRTLFGERYLRGFYFCVGVDSTNTPGDPTPPISMNDASTGAGYPDDVSHFAVSESGEVRNGVTYSVVSFVYQAPNDSRFAGVEFFVKDYPVINEIYQTYFHRYTGAPGGTGQGEIVFEVGKKRGTGAMSVTSGTVDVTGVGTLFLAELNAGDMIESRGMQGVILSVTDDVTATLVSAWAPVSIGYDVTGVEDWWYIPEVTFYAVSIGKDGTHRDDVTAAPSDTEFLDGILSPPVPPVLTGDVDSNGVSTLGEINRLEWQQLIGTEIKAYHLYRGTGFVPFLLCDHIATIEHNKNASSDGHQSFDDTNFTTTELEQNQTFSYYLVAENDREQRSDESGGILIACRLNRPSDGDPTIPARSGVLNLLYNAAFGGTAGVDVAYPDAAQDTFNNIGGAPTGWEGWTGHLFGGAVTKPKWANSDQVKLAPPGMGGLCYLIQGVNGWNHGTDPIIQTGALLTFQALIKKSGSVDGVMSMYLETLNVANASQEFCPMRYRDPADDALKWHAAGTPDSVLFISSSDLLDSWQMFFAVFKPTVTGLSVDEVRVNWGWQDGTAGLIYITQPMLSYGEELCNWTGQMIDPLLRHPGSGDPRGGFMDGPGGRKPLLDIP